MMEEKPLQNAIIKLELQLTKLLEKHEAIQQELQACKQENQQLKVQIAQKDTLLENFQNQSEITKIVEYLEGEEDPLKLREKIDEYLVEIDHCISYLNKQL